MPIDIELKVISFSTSQRWRGFYQGKLDRAEQFIYIYNEGRYLVKVGRLVNDPDPRYMGVVLDILAQLGVNSDTAIDH